VTEDEYRAQQLALENRRLEADGELNSRRYELDHARFKRENRFLSRHLAATVSLLAVIVTGTQLYFGIRKDERDRAAQAVRDEREGLVSAAQSAVTLSNFLIERQHEIFSDERSLRERTRAAILLDLPPLKREKVQTYFSEFAAGSTTSPIESSPTPRPRPPVSAPTASARPLDFKVASVDDRIRVRVNGTAVYEGGPTDWRKALLNVGMNVIEVEVFNQASYTGGIEVFGGHKREGWNYDVVFRAPGAQERRFTDRRDEPPVEQFGTWFLAQRLRVTVDAAGQIEPGEFLVP
jgi:hypothetical protein